LVKAQARQYRYRPRAAQGTIGSSGNSARRYRGPSAVSRYSRAHGSRSRYLPLLAAAILGWALVLLLQHFTSSSGENGPRALALSGSKAITLAGGPSLNAAMVNGILAAYQSPLQGQGAALVTLSARYRVDDAVALAFFVMESRAGTAGEAVHTHSFGNLRPRPGQPALDGYRFYRTWLEGASDWFSVMRSLYLDHLGLNLVSTVVPVYAPSNDHNDPPAMTAGITQLVSCWRGALTRCPDRPSAIHALVAAAVRR
jgi:hypothetical protein